MSRTLENLELIFVGWVDALRRRDVDAIAPHLAPDVVWQGLRPDLVCRNREEVLANLSDGDLRDLIVGIELLANERRVLFGMRMPGLTELFGEPVDGEMYEVFSLEGQTILRIDEFKSREAALAALDEGAEGRSPSG